MERPVTPPRATTSLNNGDHAMPPITPEQVKQMEINRLKAKALRNQREADAAVAKERETSSVQTSNGGNIAAGQKRPFSALRSSAPPSVRDGRSATPATSMPTPTGFRPLDDIQPARNFTKYVEYDFSKMTDTKGGFMTQEDDPHNRALHSRNEEEKPAHMTMKEWERHRLLKSLREQKAGPFEPGISALKSQTEQKVCRECGSFEIDFKWEEILKCAICNKCREELPDKYSLLTKTEAKEDYLLTDPELRDEELLPHIERPNPHKSTWNNMMLFLRYQVEEYAFSEKKWGSPENLDVEFEKREGMKKKRKEDKFRGKLEELKKRTRVDAWRRARQRREGEGGANFGDEVGQNGKHSHTWGRPISGDDGVEIKKCVECGMEVEELEF